MDATQVLTPHPPVFSTLEKFRYLPIWVGIFFLAASSTHADTEKAISDLSYWGIPRTETYYPRDTGLLGNIHSIHRMPDGEMAFLTSTGIYAFDGTNWTRVTKNAWTTAALELPNGKTAFAHDKGISTLVPDGKGGYEIELLTPPEKFNFGIAPIEHLAYARGYIFGHSGDNIVTIAPDGSIAHYKLSNWATSCFAIGDEIYVTGGSLSLINRWDWEKQSLADATHLLDSCGIYEWMTQAYPRAAGGVWIVTDYDKVLGFDGTTTWQWPGNEYLASRGIKIRTLQDASGDKLAIGSASQGLLVFKEDGSLDFDFSKQHGLDGVHILKLGADDQSGIWIATQNSLTRVPHTSRTSVFDENHGIVEDVQSLAFFQDRIYFGTNRGLYASNPEATKMEDLFQLVVDQNDIEDLLVYQEHLFISGARTLAINPQGELFELDATGATNFLQPKSHPGVVLAGNFQGVLRFDFQDGHFGPATQISGPKVNVYSMAENDQGEIFGSLGDNRYARIHLDDRGDSFEVHDLPQRDSALWSSIVSIDHEVYLNGNPCFRWDQSAQTFVKDPSMQYYVGAPPFGFEQVYGTSPDNAYVALNARSGLTVPRPPPQIVGDISSIGNAIDTRALCIAYDEYDGVWAGGPFGLVHSNLPKNTVSTDTTKPRIHSITSIRDGEALPIVSTEQAPLVLDYRQNSLQIKIEFPRFTAATHHQYQIHLDGFDGEWADFSGFSMREFTNLEPGPYTLRVNAKDATGRDSFADNYFFVILPPWYQTNFAYALYLLSALLLVALIVYFYNRSQIRKSRQLQILVNQRTQEIRNQNTELENQAHRLEIQNEELAHKTEELTATTETLTNTLHQLHDMQDQLVATARTAGKAEIAINVLHNVGNVLNSVNVSISILTDKVSRSNVSRLARLAELVDSRKADIHDFLSLDERGKALPTYLVKLSHSLDEEIQSVQHELGVMAEDIDHIKNIISAQQTHAKSFSVVEPINLSELCQIALNILGNERVRSSFEIINEIPKDIVIENDKHRLLEIILNLISNAQDAIREQKPDIGVLTLSAQIQPDQQNLQLHVKDNGSGISPETQEKLFRHGFTTKADGHGFGLHSSANAARTLGGNLEITSPGPQQGATATLTLPLSFKAKPAPVTVTT